MPLRQQKYKKHILGCSQKRVRFTHLQKSVHFVHFKNGNAAIFLTMLSCGAYVHFFKGTDLATLAHLEKGKEMD